MTVEAANIDILPVDPAGSEAEKVAELLRNAGLPIEDLARSKLSLCGAYDSTILVGAVGLEHCDGAGLLRSLAVTPDRRGCGLGLQLVQIATQAARDRGYRYLYLLTETAEGFFQRQAFQRQAFRSLDRAMVPDAIRRTRQYSVLCPDRATVMRMPLSAG